MGLNSFARTSHGRAAVYADPLSVNAVTLPQASALCPLASPPHPAQDVDPTVGYAYLSGPEELDEDARRATRWEDRAKVCYLHTVYTSLHTVGKTRSCSGS